MPSQRRCSPLGTATFSAIPNGSQAIALIGNWSNAMMAATEDVGTDFAEEARRMHYDEAPNAPSAARPPTRNTEPSGRGDRTHPPPGPARKEDLS